MSFQAALVGMDSAILSLLGESTLALYRSDDLGTEASVRVVFDERYINTLDGSSGLSDFGPAAFCLLADLPTDPESDAGRVFIGSREFEVIEVKKDRKSGCLLRLHEVLQ